MGAAQEEFAPVEDRLEDVGQLVTEVRDRVKNAARISLFLDFDGTLVPIEPDHTSPRPDLGMMDTLEMLSSKDFLVTTIISGRAIEDLYARIRLKGLIYAGNHGLEIFGRNLRFVEPAASTRREKLEQLCDALRTLLRPVDGVLVEFKGLTASVHYRRAEDSRRPEIEAVVMATVARAGELFHVNPGRKVFEIVPRTGWHKGAAVRWINQQLGGDKILTVYVGDDISDEDAFSVLPDAITIKVGATVTCARYRLPDPAAVHEFLLWLTLQEPSRPGGA